MIYFFSFSTVVANALARFNDVAENGRSEIWHNSWPLVGQYFPWGSGLGSFVSAYAAREPLAQVRIYYFNSLHDRKHELSNKRLYVIVGYCVRRTIKK